MPRVRAIPDLDAGRYTRHSLHAEDRVWVEKNCYVDVWIELLHALGLEPRAMLPFCIGVDFEGDQWTFYKPSHDELRELYGIEVQELNVWRPLLEHALEFLERGRVISTEADAFWLPDTSATDYRRQHTKTTIIIADVDTSTGRLGYFHNAGYFSLEGEDYARTFRLGAPEDPAFMPLFAEWVRVDGVTRLTSAPLVQRSLALWRRHLARLPAHNPVQRFGARLDADLEGLREQGLAAYHAWAFATLRQLGSAFELLAENLRWLSEANTAGLAGAIDACTSLSANTKTLILKGARAVNARRPLEARPLLDVMAADWQRAIDGLRARLG